jgi:hypothetical protein
MKSKTPPPTKKEQPKTKTTKKAKPVAAADEAIQPVPLTDLEYAIQKIVAEDGKTQYPMFFLPSW